jgi:cyclic-di-GMP phosphodiesterase TipF (flagellum assembly factor)
MPLIAHILFYVSYAVIAAAVGIALAMIGGGTGAEATLGGLSLFAACAVTHGAFTAALATRAVKGAEKRLAGEIEKMKRLHKEVAEDVEVVAERLDKVDAAMTEIAHRRAEQPAGDVRMIEAVIDRLGRSLDQRFDEFKRLSAPPAAQGPRAASPIDNIREALADNRIELHLQPVVALPQRRTAFYEGFTRLRDAAGRIIPPSEFIPAAEAAGLMSWIDDVLLFRSVQIVRKLAEKDRRIGIFCNISARSLIDEQFFPQFLDFLRENKDMAGALVFELAQADFDARTSGHARAMARLADLGYRFSIDKVTRLDVDLADLERAGVRFLKAPGNLLVQQIIRENVRPRSNIAREIAPPDVTAVFSRYGVDVIAERVEDEATVVEILDLEVPFGQGHLFGAPRPLKDSLMEATAPPPGFFEQRRAGG